jgi:hypothetical protein
MTITIIQGLWKEGGKENIYIVKVFVATRHFEILDSVLSPQAYLH